eukprot:scaffold11037_cov95-Cylindrotheca_fusiformis.AAC.1
MKTGVLAKSQRMRNLHSRIAKLTSPPQCAACRYAKAKRRPVSRPKSHSRVVDNPSSIRKDTLYPGQVVSVDHLVSSVPGRLYTGFGKGPEQSLYKGSA